MVTLEVETFAGINVGVFTGASLADITNQLSLLQSTKFQDTFWDAKLIWNGVQITQENIGDVVGVVQVGYQEYKILKFAQQIRLQQYVYGLATIKYM